MRIPAHLQIRMQLHFMGWQDGGKPADQLFGQFPASISKHRLLWPAVALRSVSVLNLRCCPQARDCELAGLPSRLRA